MLCNNYQSHNLIGHYSIWVISPRNLASFTRPLLTGRHTRPPSASDPSICIDGSLSSQSGHSWMIRSKLLLSFQYWSKRLGVCARCSHTAALNPNLPPEVKPHPTKESVFKSFHPREWPYHYILHIQDFELGGETWVACESKLRHT